MAELPQPLSGCFVSGKRNERQRGDSASGSPSSPVLEALGELERTGTALKLICTLSPLSIWVFQAFRQGGTGTAALTRLQIIPLVQMGKLRHGVVTGAALGRAGRMAERQDRELLL